jgi:glucose-1-phosphate adenylyltransferase
MIPTSQFQGADPRFTDRALALVLAGGTGSRLGGLTAWQPKAAVAFGGRYRTVDFTLSNCVNSELRRIALLTQYKAQPLIRHVMRGWGFLHREIGEYIEIWPAQQRDGERWYGGTVDAVYQNLDLIEAADPSYVLVLAGDQIYSLDYAELIEAHAATNADVTVACVELPLADASEYDGVALRQDRRIAGIGPRVWSRAKPRPAGLALVPMGVYLFSTEFLFERLPHWHQRSAAMDIGQDLVPGDAAAFRVFAHLFRKRNGPGYWRDVGTIDRYWRAHMELLEEPAPSVLEDPEWPVFTHQPPLGPAQIRPGATIEAALVSPGCRVAGGVTRSVLSSGCEIEPGASVTDSVLLPGVRVGSGCVLDRVVVDAGCAIPAGTLLGAAFGTQPGRYVSPRGVMLATSTGPQPDPYAARLIA